MTFMKTREASHDLSDCACLVILWSLTLYLALVVEFSVKRTDRDET